MSKCLVSPPPQSRMARGGTGRPQCTPHCARAHCRANFTSCSSIERWFQGHHQQSMHSHFLLHPSQNHKTHYEVPRRQRLWGGRVSAALPRDDQLGWEGRGKAAAECTGWTRAAAARSSSPGRRGGGGGGRAEGSGRLCGRPSHGTKTGADHVPVRAAG